MVHIACCGEELCRRHATQRPGYPEVRLFETLLTWILPRNNSFLVALFDRPVEIKMKFDSPEMSLAGGIYGRTGMIVEETS